MSEDQLMWLKDCELCNAGVCSQMQDYVGTGMSERAAARQMEQDCEKQFSSEQIYSRYRYYAKGHSGGPSVGNPHKSKSPSPEQLDLPVGTEEPTEGQSNEPGLGALFHVGRAISWLDKIKLDDPDLDESVNTIAQWVIDMAEKRKESVVTVKAT